MYLNNQEFRTMEEYLLDQIKYYESELQNPNTPIALKDRFKGNYETLMRVLAVHLWITQKHPISEF